MRREHIDVMRKWLEAGFITKQVCKTIRGQVLKMGEGEAKLFLAAYAEKHVPESGKQQ